MRMIRPVSVLVALSAAVGCQPNGALSPNEKNLGTGLLLELDHFLQTDVVGVHIEIDREKCFKGENFEDFHFERNVGLIDGILPGGIDLIGLDEDSKHRGADLFIELAPGCYEVKVVPASAIYDNQDAFEPSEDCWSAKIDTEIWAGQTTEEVILLQCEGDSDGALDTLIVFNNPPEIEVDIEEKVALECESRQVCVRASDPNDDPVDIDLELLSGKGSLFGKIQKGDLELVGYDGARVWQQCFEFVPEETGTLEFQAVVHDLGLNDKGKLVRMEKLTGRDSHDKLKFPIHTVWEEPLCLDDWGNVVAVDGQLQPRVPGCDYMTAEEFYCEYYGDPDLAELICDGHDLLEEVYYPDCDEVGGEDPQDDDDDKKDDDDDKGGEDPQDDDDDKGGEDPQDDDDDKKDDDDDKGGEDPQDDDDDDDKKLWPVCHYPDGQDPITLWLPWKAALAHIVVHPLDEFGECYGPVF